MGYFTSPSLALIGRNRRSGRKGFLVFFFFPLFSPFFFLVSASRVFLLSLRTGMAMQEETGVLVKPEVIRVSFLSESADFSSDYKSATLLG